MDASQYKDYVLVLLFIKYTSDKYVGQPFAPVTIPEGASFKDMVALKGKPSIGDDINKKIIAPLRDAKGNNLFSMPDFNDPEKLGSGKEMVDRLTNLIAIFEKPALDFSKNRAEGVDILGDAYEYLMRHFATESGKSKGQFYTPAEVSRVIAKIIGINKTNPADTSDIAVYDPTCGSGSLLLKVAEEANRSVGLFGQEKDAATSGLARMNMILHNNPTAEIKQGNTLANPLFLAEGRLQTVDYVVANPPFSDKRWSNGVSVDDDPYNRFDSYGAPPDKNGDYAYLLHIIRSLKSRGKGACILPHGVLFRGNVESSIRKTLIKKGLIKGIIGLPANLFYGTGIPAYIIVIDKENAANRKAIFMVDAGKGFIKDGNKNRLREMDIHKMVDVFNKHIEIVGYSRIVPVTEIENNDFNLNIPRYIDSSEAEDLQDIEAHLLGGIPQRDIDALHAYWQVFPSLRNTLFEAANRTGYLSLQIANENIKAAIYEHPEFVSFIEQMNRVFIQWCDDSIVMLKALESGFHPKELIHTLSENLLTAYTDKPLLNKYDVYQHLMNFWADVMQDDCYLIAVDGWVAETYRIIEEKKNKDNKVIRTIDKGWTCDLIPKPLVINRYFYEQQQAIDDQKIELEGFDNQLIELEEQHNEEGALNGFNNKTDANIALYDYIYLAWSAINTDTLRTYKAQIKELEIQETELLSLLDHYLLRDLKNSKANLVNKVITDRLKQDITNEKTELLNRYLKTTKLIKDSQKFIKDLREAIITDIKAKIADNIESNYLLEISVIYRYLDLIQTIADSKKAIREAEAALDAELLDFYPTLNSEQIKQLVVDDKWMVAIDAVIHSEMNRVSQQLTQRITELAESYATPLPQITANVANLSAKVAIHLKNMGVRYE
jgi:type I restriction enzyme M protein